MPTTGFLGWAYISGSTVDIAGGLSDKQVNFMSGSTISGSDGLVYNYETNVLSASNIISASAYYGDASNLTNTPAGSPAGSDTQVQFNDGGSFSGSSGMVFNKTSNVLTVTGDITSSANISGSAFYGDGSNLSGVSASPDGSDTQVQFNDGGSAFGGDAGFTYNKTTNSLTVVGDITSSGVISSSANISGSAFYGDGSNLSGISAGSPAGSDTQVQFNDGGSFAGDSGMVFNKTSNVLSVTGDITSSANISASIFYGSGAGITGVTAAPAGSTTQLQFNDGGTTGASADLTYNDSTNTLVLTGTLIATGSVAHGYIFSLSGSTFNSSYGSSVSGKYALVADDNVLIDAGPSASAELSLISANGKVTIGAGGYGGSPTDIMGARLDSSQAGSVNTIASYTGAGINAHSINRLSLSGSAIHLTASTLIVTSALGTSNLNVLGDITSSTNISASAFYGDGSNLTGVGGGSAAGSDTYIQFNDGGSSFGGEANFTFNKTTDVFNVSGSTRITGALDQGNNSTDNYFKISSAYNAAQSNISGEFFHFPSVQATVAGEVYYMSGTANPVVQLTASAVGGGAASLVGLAVGTALATDGLLLRGFYTFSGTATGSISGAVSAGAFEEGKQIYASEVTPGYLTTVQPSTSGNVVRVLGHAVTTTMMYFNPSPDFVTV
jgi:hypothetical protein